MNPLTGRRLYAIRHVPSGKEGDPYDWSCICVQKWYLSNIAEMELLSGKGATKNTTPELAAYLRKKLKVKRIKALRKGRWVYY
jgi:hypothetical protein